VLEPLEDLILVFVLRGPGRRVADLPEVLDEDIAVAVIGQLQENLPFLGADDVGDELEEFLIDRVEALDIGNRPRYLGLGFGRRSGFLLGRSGPWNGGEGQAQDQGQGQDTFVHGLKPHGKLAPSAVRPGGRPAQGLFL
jgi:hypothetical protein